MNDFSELESELKKLRPASVSDKVSVRIGQIFLESASHSERSGAALATTDSVLRSRPAVNWVSLGLGLAAAAGFLVFAQLEVNEAPHKQLTLAAISPIPARAAQIAAAGALLPSGMTQVVYNRQDEGLHFTEGARRPVRRVRTEAREILHWRNPTTGVSLRVSYPREEVALIPVSCQ